MNLSLFSLPVNKNALRFKFKLVKDSVWVVAGSQQVHVLALGLLGELIYRSMYAHLFHHHLMHIFRGRFRHKDETFLTSTLSRAERGTIYIQPHSSRLSHTHTSYLCHSQWLLDQFSTKSLNINYKLLSYIAIKHLKKSFVLKLFI